MNHLVVAAVIAATLLAISAAPSRGGSDMGPEGRAHGGPQPLVSSSADPLGPRTVILTTMDAAVPEGQPAIFQLNVTGTNCGGYTTPPPAGELATRVTLAMGDGLTIGLAVVTEFSCTAFPWVLSYSVEYRYHNLGTANVTANVLWGDGYNGTSNGIQISIRLPLSGATDIARDWLIGTAAVGGTLVFFVVGLRRIVPPRAMSPP